MNFIKRNKFTIIAIVIFLLFVALLIVVKNFFFPNSADALYGNRLDGIEEVEISDSTIDEVKEKLSEESVSSTTARISGRTVEIIITANDDVSLETAKTYVDKAIEPFSEEEKGYYDFQVFVKKNTEANDFPIIGYRHRTSDKFTWTKDRGAE